MPGHSHYCASKFALDALSEILAAEVRPFGIRVAIVEPGVVLTPIFSKSRIMKLEDLHPYEMCIRRLRGLFDSTLHGTPTMPEEVAETIAHAVLTDEPRLRYLVGRDAEVLLALRMRLSDEEWIRLHTIEDDREFGRALNEAVGFELYAGTHE